MMMSCMKCVPSLGPKMGSRQSTAAVVRRRFFSSQQQAGPGQRPLSTMPQLQEQHHGGGHHFRHQYAMQSPQFKFQLQQQKVASNDISLRDFVDRVPLAIRARQILQENSERVGGGDAMQDPVMGLFQKLNLQPQDWAQYAHFDATKAYTRNLIATDELSYTLLLLCWNPDKESPIHDHPCDGCWLQVLQGQVQECRYEYPTATDTTDNTDLNCIADLTFSQGQVAFINDSIGLHKVGNPSSTVPAVTLHLYAPPFQECKVWVPEDDSNDNCGNGTEANACVTASSNCSVCFSEYGRVL